MDTKTNSDFASDTVKAIDGTDIKFEWRWEVSDGLVKVYVRHADGHMSMRETGPGHHTDAAEALKSAREMALEDYPA